MAARKRHAEGRPPQGADPTDQCHQERHLAPAEHLRGHEHTLLRAFQRSRREGAGSHPAPAEGHARPQAAAPAHAERPRLRARRELQARVARTWQVRPRDGRAAEGRHRKQAAEVPGRVWRDAARAGTPEPPHRGRNARHAHGLLDEHHDARDARPHLRRRHCRGPRRDLLGRYGQGRAAAFLQHLQCLRPACLRQYHTRRGHPAAARGALSGPCRTGGRGRPHAPRSLRPGLPAPHSQPHNLFTHGRARAAPTDVHGPVARQGAFRHSLPPWLRGKGRLALPLGGDTGGHGPQTEGRRRRGRAVDRPLRQRRGPRRGGHPRRPLRHALPEAARRAAAARGGPQVPQGDHRRERRAQRWSGHRRTGVVL